MMQISQCAILLRNKWLKNPIKLNGKVKDRKLCNKKGVCSKQKVVVVNKAKLSNLAKKTKNENQDNSISARRVCRFAQLSYKQLGRVQLPV